MEKMPHERLRPLLNDEMKWNLLADHLGRCIANLVLQLETCSPEKLGSLQGQVQSYKTLLALKETLKAEGKTRG